MILLTIVLSGAGVVIAALAILAYNLIAANSRWSRRAHDLAAAHAKLQEENITVHQELSYVKEQNDDLQRENQRYRESVAATMTALHADNRRLLAENAALNARNTALVEAMEVRPTQPKRTVRKNSTAGEQP